MGNGRFIDRQDSNIGNFLVFLKFGLQFSMKEGWRDRKTEKQKDRETVGQMDRETERQKDRETERQKGDGQKDGMTERQRDRKKQRDKDREIDGQKDNEYIIKNILMIFRKTILLSISDIFLPLMATGELIPTPTKILGME